MARAGLNRKSALATATLVLAAEAPDLDVVTELRGNVFAFVHHRGISHTFVGVPMVAAFVVVVLWIYWRLRHRGESGSSTPQPRWGILFLLGCLAALTHILLDFTNSYGVRPFMPFSYRWYSWDIVSIVEPVLWLILGLGLILPMLSRLVENEIGARRRTPRGRGAAIVALSLVACFWMFRDYEHRRALAAMDSLTYQGLDADRISAYPYTLNPFRWYGVVETSAFFERLEVNSGTAEVDPRNEAQIRYKAEETPATLAAKKSYLGRAYLDWAQYPVTEVEQLSAPRSGYVVRFFDLRYLYPDSTHYPLSGWVQLDANLKVVAESAGGRNYPGRNTQADSRR